MTIQNRFKTFDFWDGAIFGGTAVSIFALAIAFIFSTNSEEIYTVLATMFAIPVAFAAALIAFWTTRYQIQHERARDLASAKVVLPLALTRMIEVSNNAILLASGQHPNPPASLEDARVLLSLDETIIRTIRDNVRSADPRTEAWMAVLIARYQVYFSRIESWWNSPNPTTDAAGVTTFDFSREDALMDWATFRALVEHHFDYARPRGITVPMRLDVTRIRSAFFINIHHVDFDQRFENRLNTRTGRLEDGNIEHFIM